MKAGSLNRRVTIEAQSSTTDALGQPVDTWTNHAVVWADVRLKSGLQALKADADVSVVQASIRIRYRADIHAGMRVSQGSTVYEILAVLPDVSGRQYTDLVCQVVT
jgi:SPP1 family predicted phage head-tail adaptor